MYESLVTLVWMSVVGVVLVVTWYAISVCAGCSTCASDARHRWPFIRAAGTVGVLRFCDALCVHLEQLVLLIRLLSKKMCGITAAALVTAGLVLTAAPALAAGSLAPVSLMAMYLLFLGMYWVRQFRGGADAKCMMCLTLTFLVYPVTGSLPVLWEVPYPASMALNPSVPVLIVTLVLPLLQCIQVAFRNVRAGRLCRDILANYRIGTDEARTAHIWPVEKMSDVGVLRCHPSDDRNSVLDGLEAVGSADTLVTPMVPFLLSLATASAVMMVLGSFLAALLGV